MKKIITSTLTALLLGTTVFASGASAASVEQDAISKGKQLTKELNQFNLVINSGDLSEINSLYDSFSQQIKMTEKAIGKVSGSSRRTSLNNQYVKQAKIARERVIYEVSQWRLLDSIDGKLETTANVNVTSDLAKLSRLKKRAGEIKKAGGYQPLPTSITVSLTDWETDIRSHKNPPKENTLIYVEKETNNTKESSISLDSGVIYNGTVTRTVDHKDIYELNVQEPGEVKLEVYMDAGYYVVTDELGNEIDLIRPSFTASHAGKYYLEFIYDSGDYPDTQQYVVKATYPSDNQNGSNDTTFAAYPIKSERTYFSTLDSAKDIDFYKITVESLGEIFVELGFNTSNKEIYIYDKYGNELAKDIGYPNVSFKSKYVGEYYVSVNGIGGQYSTTNPYSIKVTFPAKKKY